jgi:cubilin
LTEPSGVVSSPNYPNDYPNDAACTWEIAVEEGKRIRLKFNYFHLEASVGCDKDYLEIYDGATYEM